ncbi:MAG TPA: hypothetical protein VFC06_04335 [Demequina sp.]|nr:hypothetical protein [Demequina sp.]
MIEHEDFVECVRERKRARVVFASQKEGGTLRERICAPMDFGPDRRAADTRDRYHFFDLDAGHLLKKFPKDIVRFEPLGQTFEPADFVTWDVRQSPWWLKRDWGVYS